VCFTSYTKERFRLNLVLKDLFTHKILLGECDFPSAPFLSHMFVAPCKAAVSTIKFSLPRTACHLGFQKAPGHYMLTQKVPTALFAEMLDSCQHSAWLILESQSCTL
jgi:hypothetical protein